MINLNNHFTYFSFFIDVISEKNLVLFVNLRFDWQRYSKNNNHHTLMPETLPTKFTHLANQTKV